MPAGSGDRWPEDYERGRPGWPADVARIADLPPAATVLDLGAGTGKLTRLLVPAFERVVAVEPAEAMRGLLTALCAGAEVLSGTGHEIPLAEASVDAVFAAQAYHWFDDERAIAEMARVLRPRGALVLMWNLPAGPWEPSTSSAEELLSEHELEGRPRLHPARPRRASRREWLAARRRRFAVRAVRGDRLAQSPEARP